MDSDFKWDVFLSHSSKNSDVVRDIATRLREDGIRVWLDEWEILPGDNIPARIEDGLNHSRVLVLCISADALGSEWAQLESQTFRFKDPLNASRRFIPLRLDDSPITGSLGQFLAIRWQDSTAYGDLRNAVVLAGRGRPTKDVGSRAGALSGPKIDVRRVSVFAPEILVGREEELGVLSNAWENCKEAGSNHHTNILAVVALGGEGKTSLVAKWLTDLSTSSWDGVDIAFAWSFYSQGSRDQSAASSDLFLREALAAFGEPQLADSSISPFEKGTQLGKIVGEQRAIVILDGLEPLQLSPSSPEAGRLRDPGITGFLLTLAAVNRGLCIITTRYEIRDLRGWTESTVRRLCLNRLSTEAGVELLRGLGITGSLVPTTEYGSKPMNDYERLVEDVEGHALTLQILGRFLYRAHGGDIRRRDRIDFEKADERTHGGHAFRTMRAYVAWLSGAGVESRRELALISLMGLFEHPAPIQCINALRRSPAIPDLTEPLIDLDDEEWELALTALIDAKLLNVTRDTAGNPLLLDAHPMVREFFSRELTRTDETTGAVPTAWRIAHHRLFEYLTSSTREPESPSLTDLQPLYHAVNHGCHAGLYDRTFQEVYHGRIGKACYYAPNKLGVWGAELGAIASFFEVPWSKISPELSIEYQAELYHEAAYTLRALGRLKEAILPFEKGVELIIRIEDWGEAARAVGNLSELQLLLGDIAEARKNAGRSIEYAEKGGDQFSRYMRWVSRAILADAMFEWGERDVALGHFQEADNKRSEIEPARPMVYGRNGFEYCDALLLPVEQEFWRRICSQRREEAVSDAHDEILEAVHYRASRTLVWTDVERHPGLQGTALDQLTLVRVQLYRDVLSNRAVDQQLRAEDCVLQLRRAGQLHFLSLGLMTLAAIACIEEENETSLAIASLNEAWEIVSRGPMVLLTVDVLLYRVRLFAILSGATSGNYPWGTPKADISMARDYINSFGYNRRQTELRQTEEWLAEKECE